MKVFLVCDGDEKRVGNKRKDGETKWRDVFAHKLVITAESEGV